MTAATRYHSSRTTVSRHCVPALTVLTVLAVFSCARAASAQGDGEPDPNQVKVRFGPLWINPIISLNNIGIDRNVFNDPPTVAAREDFTFTVTPSTDLWLRLGPTWLLGQIKENINWYQKYASERNATSEYVLNWKVPLSRFEIRANADYSSAEGRPGFEIDARVARKVVTYGGSVKVRALTKTFFGVTYSKAGTLFDSNATFLDVNLHDELSRKSTTAGIQVRHQLTPLTSISVNASQTTENFDYSALRDSTSNQITAGVAFDPFALVKGTATIGYRAFTPASSDLPDFKGVTAAVNLSYALFGATRLAFTALRDIQYSFDDKQPYYLQTGFSGSLAQQIFGPVDVVARAALQHLAYRDRAGVVILVADRTDEVRSYGIGVGFHMGKDLRLGFNLDKANRISKIASREYGNVMFGSQITYGVP